MCNKFLPFLKKTELPVLKAQKVIKLKVKILLATMLANKNALIGVINEKANFINYRFQSSCALRLAFTIASSSELFKTI